MDIRKFLLIKVSVQYRAIEYMHVLDQLKSENFKVGYFIGKILCSEGIQNLSGAYEYNSRLLLLAEFASTFCCFSSCPAGFYVPY